MLDSGQISPDLVDVAFIDSRLGKEEEGGTKVMGWLLHRSLVRLAYGKPRQTSNVESPARANKIVTVGISSEPEKAQDLGSYSDVLGQPLIVEWQEKPLDLSSIVKEVRRLKKLPNPELSAN
jgi:hypothetical protein